jgi:hypothetical protein
VQVNEAEVKSEMRLWALETLVANAFAMLCALDPQPDDFVTGIRQQMIEAARKQGFPGFDPAESDVLSAEFEAALSRLLEMVATQMHLGLGKSGR